MNQRTRILGLTFAAIIVAWIGKAIYSHAISETLRNLESQEKKARADYERMTRELARKVRYLHTYRELVRETVATDPAVARTTLDAELKRLLQAARLTSRVSVRPSSRCRTRRRGWFVCRSSSRPKDRCGT